MCIQVFISSLYNMHTISSLLIQNLFISFPLLNLVIILCCLSFVSRYVIRIFVYCSFALSCICILVSIFIVRRSISSSFLIFVLFTITLHPFLSQYFYLSIPHFVSKFRYICFPHSLSNLFLLFFYLSFKFNCSISLRES